MLFRADAFVPKLFPFQAKRKDAAFTEVHKDAAAIRNRRARRIAMIRQIAAIGVFRQIGGHVLFPQHLAGQVEAYQVTRELGDITFPPTVAITAVAGDEDFLADDDRTGRTCSGQFHFPDDIFLRAPGGGQVFVTGDA